MSGAVETELRKLEKIVPGLLKTNEKMEMVSFLKKNDINILKRKEFL